MVGTSWKRAIPSLLTLVLILGASGAGAETRVGSTTVKGTAEWTKEGSPYIITGDVRVPAGSQLHIGPGVTVRFKPDIATHEGLNGFDLEIFVEGLLTAEGADGDTIVLTTDANRPAYTDWQGIVVQGPGARVELDGVVVEFANEGIRSQKGEVVVRNSTIRKCSQYGIVLYESKGEFDNVFFTAMGNRGGTAMGLSVDRGSEVKVDGCYIVGVQNGLSFARSSSGTVSNTLITNCAERAVLVRNSNPVLTGCTITSNELGFSLSANALPVVQGNNIFENGTFDVTISNDYDGEPVKLDMTGNWWGETALGLIEERIQDGLDNEEVKAFVVIEPVRTEAVVREEPSGP